jgi:hypothetical protein
VSGRAYSKSQYPARAEVNSEVNRLYGMSSSDGPHLHAFLNPLILILARSLVQKASTVS